VFDWTSINPLNAELNPICHLLALLGALHILHVSGLRVKNQTTLLSVCRTKLKNPVPSWGEPTLIVGFEPGDIGTPPHVLPYVGKVHPRKGHGGPEGELFYWSFWLGLFPLVNTCLV